MCVGSVDFGAACVSALEFTATANPFRSKDIRVEIASSPLHPLRTTNERFAPRIYLPEETPTGINRRLENTSLLDFWKWAFSDLCDDDLKGIFAEWIVLKLLEIPSVRRVNWANSDIITPEGVRIEIKATSYWQSWKILDEQGALRPVPLHPVSPKTQIRFSGLKARDAVAVPNSNEPQIFKSHIYIFAFQRERQFERWNAMDLSQWEFYALPVSVVGALGSKSVSLKMLRVEQKRLCGHETLTAESFPKLAQTLIEAAAKTLGNLSTEHPQPS